MSYGTLGTTDLELPVTFSRTGTGPGTDWRVTGILKSVKHFRDEFGESLTTVWVQLGDDAGVVKFTVPSILATDE